jgi:hypothetical protein
MKKRFLGNEVIPHEGPSPPRSSGNITAPSDNMVRVAVTWYGVEEGVAMHQLNLFP